MLSLTKNAGYEVEKFLTIPDAQTMYINPENLFYKFSVGGDVGVFNSHRESVFVEIVRLLQPGEPIILIGRSSNNQSTIFAHCLKMMFPRLKLDRDISKFTTTKIPKISSAIKMHVDNPQIEFYLATSFESLVANVDNISFPVVYKPANGCHGRGIFKIDNIPMLRNTQHDFKGGSNPVFLQEFLNKKFEYRVMTFNGRTVNFAKKMLKTEDGNQFGGRRFVATGTLHQDYIDYITAHGRDGLVGIDIARTRDGRIIIIEENRAPEFESLDRATGVSTAKLIYNAFIEDEEDNNDDDGQQ